MEALIMKIKAKRLLNMAVWMDPDTWEKYFLKSTVCAFIPILVARVKLLVEFVSLRVLWKFLSLNDLRRKFSCVVLLSH
jgi:hypothetical protein